MNPWALIIVALGLLLIVIGVRGSYPAVIGMLSGKSGPFYKPNAPKDVATQPGGPVNANQLPGFTTP